MHKRSVAGKVFALGAKVSIVIAVGAAFGPWAWKGYLAGRAIAVHARKANQNRIKTSSMAELKRSAEMRQKEKTLFICVERRRR